MTTGQKFKGPKSYRTALNKFGSLYVDSGSASYLISIDNLCLSFVALAANAAVILTFSRASF